MRNYISLLALVVFMCECSTSWARGIYVDNERGDDAADGLSPEKALKSIAKAIELAEAGDTIHLKPSKSPYKEEAAFRNKSGLPGRPIVLEGHGATISGCEPLVEADWHQVAPGLYRNDMLIPHNNAVIARFYFIFNGKMNHMGRTSKGLQVPFKPPNELSPGEWTYQKDEHAFYIKTEPGKSLAKYRIEAPMRANGVSFSGTCEHIVIRNLIATHVWNDGYNIHGKTCDILFENVTAIECGDDGLSAHDDCEVRVDGLVSIGNSTGICNVNDSRSINNRVFIKDCLGQDFYMLGTNHHTLTNSIIYCTAQRAITVQGEQKDDRPCTVKMENVVLLRTSDTPKSVRVAKKGIFVGKRLTIFGVDFDASDGIATLTDSVIGGEPPPEIILTPRSVWKADRNVYDVKHIRVGQMVYGLDDFHTYRNTTGQDQHSMWIKVMFNRPLDGQFVLPVKVKDVGADIEHLSGLGVK